MSLLITFDCPIKLSEVIGEVYTVQINSNSIGFLK